MDLSVKCFGFLSDFFYFLVNFFGLVCEVLCICRLDFSTFFLFLDDICRFSCHLCWISQHFLDFLVIFLFVCGFFWICR